ncbi:hypothetical protein IEQ34_016661 [Dendrobium chrysotoxum]|uniref:Uncharacterized protein n=1 Tax=Dendrobium chrysotoxum TaxID=161865 RepID=A0AAV7GEW1_DENCH|nr:hypothetical protein IEQ34_016661 [Dendrobium chrysotoxum]
MRLEEIGGHESRRRAKGLGRKSRSRRDLEFGEGRGGFGRTYLKFPWRPFISILGTTTYDLNEEFKIVKHSESWNISPLEAIGQIFTTGSTQADE